MSSMKPWSVLKSKRLLSHRLFDIQEVSAESPYTKKIHPFIYLDSQDWVNIVPITPDHQLIMIEQYRHGSQSISLEIPGGMIDSGETAEQAAIRECIEESGYAVTELISLGNLSPNPAILNNRLHTYYGVDAHYVGTDHHSNTENTQLVKVDLDDIQGLMMSGKIDHALVCATLWRLLALRHHLP